MLLDGKNAEQGMRCRALWLALIGSQLQDACGVHFNYPKGSFEEGDKAETRSITEQLRQKIEHYSRGETLMNSSTPVCNHHIGEAKKNLIKVHFPVKSGEDIELLKKVKNKEKKCGECRYCARSYLYRHEKRPVNLDVRHARHWMETERMDWAFQATNLGDVYLKKTFAIVQEAISAEKHLHDVFSHQFEVYSQINREIFRDQQLYAAKLTKRDIKKLVQNVKKAP